MFALSQLPLALASGERNNQDKALAEFQKIKFLLASA